MEKGLQAILAIVSAIIGLAILSVIISRQSQAPQVITAASGALSRVINAAVNPVATAGTNGNVSANSFSPASVADYFTDAGQAYLKQSYENAFGALN